MVVVLVSLLVPALMLVAVVFLGRYDELMLGDRRTRSLPDGGRGRTRLT
ncbi:hypothetical protein [Streptomyces sp. NPDC047108]